MRYEMEYGAPVSVAQSAASERASFIRRTYAHLAGAILAFIALEAALLQVVTPQEVFGVLGNSPWAWLVVLGVFMVGGWVAQAWAQSQTSPAMQYLGLGLYVVLEALIFLPLLMIAS